MEESQDTNKTVFIDALSHPLACFLTALRFLTILPINWKAEDDGRHFQGSLYYFPLIGGLIGGVCAAIYLLLSSFLPISVTVALMVLLLGLASGFLHMDGLADTSDGFLSSRPRARILEIMRDSRIGAMGVIAIIGVMILKYSALASLGKDLCFTSLWLMPLGGRVAIVISMAILPYARKEEGLGSLFYSENCAPAAVWSFFCLLFCGYWFGLPAALLLGATTLGAVFVFSYLCRKIIGGATGDTLGAICEITEASLAVSLTCLVPYS